MSTQTDNILSHTNEMSTQAEDYVHPRGSQIKDSKIDNNVAPSKGQADKSTKHKVAVIRSHLNFDSHILAMADTLIADTDAILSSSLNVSQQLDDAARDILEAKSVLEKIDEKTKQVFNKLEMMNLSFNSAHLQLNNARALHHSIFDHKYEEDHQDKMLADMLHSFQVIEQAVEQEAVEKWPSDKVNRTLASIDQLYNQNESLYDFNVIREIISTIMEHFKKIDAPWIYQHLWLVDTDATEFLKEIRETDHVFAKSNKAVLHIAKNKQISAPASKIVVMKYCKERLSRPQLQLLQRTRHTSNIEKILTQQKDLLRDSVSIRIKHDCGSPSTEGVSQLKNTVAGVVKNCRCPFRQPGDLHLDIFCDSFFRQLGDEIGKLLEGKPGQDAMTMALGAKHSIRALRIALIASQSNSAKDISAASRDIDEAKLRGCAGLTEMDKIALAHLGSCEVCKRTRGIFLANLKEPF
ncbi:hypothetical protein N0V93_005430 [Gnomoniopsis smithogilvyi]|uniref:Uncharacterized protein n=1 Tax=Gnomoniopsis smithogilvyi TaxID=1191159 RepID=A0A9W8YVJ7_9PEZI|nr:hypothetical protein N0V93_005430 [Gnomoniopsis smithogilvyi]